MTASLNTKKISEDCQIRVVSMCETFLVYVSPVFVYFQTTSLDRKLEEEAVYTTVDYFINPRQWWPRAGKHRCFYYICYTSLHARSPHMKK